MIIGMSSEFWMHGYDKPYTQLAIKHFYHDQRSPVVWSVEISKSTVTKKIQHIKSTWTGTWMNGYCDQNRSAIDTVENPTAKQQQKQWRRNHRKTLKWNKLRELLVWIVSIYNTHIAYTVLNHGDLIKGNFMQLAVLFNDDVDADDVIMTMCNTCISFDHDLCIWIWFLCPKK